MLSVTPLGLVLQANNSDHYGKHLNDVASVCADHYGKYCVFFDLYLNFVMFDYRIKFKEQLLWNELRNVL